MKRLVILAVTVAAAGIALAAAPANAQTVCCVDPGMRGPVAAPAYGPPPAYGAPGYRQVAPESGLRGYVGVEYSKARLDPATPSPRIETWTGEAAISTPFTHGLGLQADIKAARYSGPFGEDWVTSPTLHIYRRNAFGAYGAFAGVSNEGGATLYGAGVEGQANMSGATLYGTLGFGRLNNGVDSNVFAAKLEGRYFLTENMRLDASVGYLRQTAGNVRSEAVVSAIGAEYQLGMIPAAIHVGYRHAEAKNSAIESDTLRVGMRWSLNGDTLVDRDRLGPSFGNISDIFMGN